MLDIFPAPVRDRLLDLQRSHGDEALTRINRYLGGNPADAGSRHPLQRAPHILPGLTGQPWHDVSRYPGLCEAARELEEKFPVIREEFLARAASLNALVAYSHSERNDGWKALYLYENGQPVTANHAFFPETVRCVKTHLEPFLYSLGEVHFSILEPGMRIPPHCDQHNFTLSLHLGIDLPDNCGISVAGETRQWEEGKTLLFDHSFEHTAWNESDRRRAVLIMDIWNPETSVAERQALGSIFKWLFDSLPTDGR